MFPSPSKELKDFIDNIDVTADSDMFNIRVPESKKPKLYEWKTTLPPKKEIVDIDSKVNATTCLLYKQEARIKKDTPQEQKDVCDNKQEFSCDPQGDACNSQQEFNCSPQKSFDVLKHRQTVKNIKLVRLCKARGWINKEKSNTILRSERIKL